MCQHSVFAFPKLLPIKRLEIGLSTRNIQIYMINVAIARSEIKSLKMDQNKKIMNAICIEKEAKTKSTHKNH